MTDPSAATHSFCLRIDVADEIGVTRVSPQGEIDLSNAEMLREALTQRQISLKPTVLDMSSVSFIDSSALLVLMEADAASRAAGGSLVISSPTRVVEKALKLAGLWDRLQIVSDSGQATAARTEVRRVPPARRVQMQPARHRVREWAPSSSFGELEAN